ncbi:hypothetical protein GP486_001758 [Trichoglossum hirsutum]|uniref:Mitochondrial inner membrane protein 1 n=1 Tax=Trichoglossum hirsutum TaxID=265104 RepID=A0A9P8LFJ0_9PEZI|nr:hypothetical protein GP486_001758 [Trichoglossum hirsutum]
MLSRSAAGRSALRSFVSASSSISRTPVRSTFSKAQLASPLGYVNTRRPQLLSLVAYRPISASVQRYATLDGIDRTREEAAAKKKLEAIPAAASVSSSTVPIIDASQEKDIDMLKGIRTDMKTIKETFNLGQVPREAYYIGLAGVLPYLGTSLTTVYLAWDINHASVTGHGFLLSGQNAELLLNFIEPLQVGYGAVILSFLGAIHWGLEWAGHGGYHHYRRYAIGVVAPAVAWPTILLPVEYALIAQFLAFNFLYFADARASSRGWAPAWYGTYRFVLTFIVGASIVFSLVGRGQIGDKIGRVSGPADRLQQLRDALEKEEEEKRASIVAKDEAEEE